VDKTCGKCRYYLPRETTCLIKYKLGRTVEIAEIKKALLYGECEDFKEKIMGQYKLRAWDEDEEKYIISYILPYLSKYDRIEIFKDDIWRPFETRLYAGGNHLMEPEENMTKRMTLSEAYEQARSGDKISNCGVTFTKGQEEMYPELSLALALDEEWIIVQAEPKVLTVDEYISKNMDDAGASERSSFKHGWKAGEDNQRVNHNKLRDACKTLLETPSTINIAQLSCFNDIADALKNIKPLNK